MCPRQRNTKHRRHRATRTTNRPDPVGTIELSHRGFGFCSTPEGEWFIPAKFTNGAMPGDTVAVRPQGQYQGEGRRVARVVRVIHRTHTHVQGRYEVCEGICAVVPLDSRINFDVFVVPDERSPKAQDGDIVDVKIVSYPSRHETCIGIVTKVVGAFDQGPALDGDIAILAFNLETEFTQRASAQASSCKLDVEAALAEPLRKDLRDQFIFTIDPADARDFDDAISIEAGEGDTWKLGVHIADVSAYVPWGSPLDLDARRRATSTYLADRVVPMLPEALSNELCSLNPNKDRLSFTVDMVVGHDGEIRSAHCFTSVMRSKARFNYDQVLEWLEGTAPWPNTQTQQAMELLEQLARARAARRHGRGGIDFDGVELKVALDAEGNVTELTPKRRTRSTGMIEEAMICANEVVAHYLEGQGLPCVFRVHDAPALDSLAAIVPLLAELNYPTEGVAEGRPQALQAVLEYAAHRPEKDLVETKVLRAMKRAVYSPQNIGHFGLASDSYCHFTSPIRRYPDLVCHRLLQAALLGCFNRDGSINEKTLASAAQQTPAIAGVDDMVRQLPWLAEHSSKQERNAAEAQADSTLVKVLRYMEQFVGTRYVGYISGVSTSGLTVTLPNTVRGFVPVRSVGNEYFDYDDVRGRLVGEETGTVWRIGKQVRLELMEVRIPERQIIFNVIGR